MPRTLTDGEREVLAELNRDATPDPPSDADFDGYSEWLDSMQSAELGDFLDRLPEPPLPPEPEFLDPALNDGHPY